MLARHSHHTFAVAVAAFALLLAAPSLASAGTCGGRGYKVVKKTEQYRVLTKVMKTGRFRDWREEFSKPPVGSFACSNRFHKRTYLGLSGGGEDGLAWTRAIVANYRFAAAVVGGTNNLDGGGDYYVRLADLTTGKQLGEFAASDRYEAGKYVSALVLSDWGALGWIEASSGPSVWLRTRGRPRLLATGPEIDPKFLKFDWVNGGRGMIWSTGNSVTKSPAT